MKKIFPFFIIVITVILFFYPFVFRGLLPIPSDTIVGLYHPFRDLYAKNYPNGIPFKNFLITDPVRQLYPWKDLSISAEKNLRLPLWNPYSFAGTPLLANFQSAAFYPLNILFFILPFSLSWSILILLEPLLAGLFLYLYLRNLNLDKTSSFFGSIAFAFSGFFIAWLEWGNVLQTALWLPLILISIDKLMKDKSKTWYLLLLFSLIFSFFGGHLQTFFYIGVLSFFYFVARFLHCDRKINILFSLIITAVTFLIITSVQWLPTLQFINLSLRDMDQSWHNPGWFIPWQNLIQFVAPDFFGNPTTLNYWGVWNYAEFIGYVGILPLILACFALFFRRDKKTLFFGTAFFVSLIFALPNIFAKIPYVLGIPFISTSQPTRLLFITDFSLSVLSAFGFNYFFKNKKGIFYILGFFVLIFCALWGFVLVLDKKLQLVSLVNLDVAKHNLVFPTVLFVTVLGVIIIYKIMSSKKILGNYLLSIFSYLFILILIFDLFRNGWKFTPFTSKEYLFPQTKTIDYLQHQPGVFRIMATDSTIFPPDFSVYYRLQSVDGYDPLYVGTYGELIAAYGRGTGNIQGPYGFNRIITPQNYDGRIMDLLGVRYVLSVIDMKSVNLRKVFQEGDTRVYENKAAFNRAFFISNTLAVPDKQTAINAMFDLNYLLSNRAVVQTSDGKLTKTDWSGGIVRILSYRENNIDIKTTSNGEGFLVLTDTYYPTWHATIDGSQTKIYLTDYNFRGIIVPKGIHDIKFYDSLF